MKLTIISSSTTVTTSQIRDSVTVFLVVSSMNVSQLWTTLPVSVKALGKVRCHCELVQLATAKHCLALHEVGYRHIDIINDPLTT